MRLANKIALVTGAGSGFGKAIAETFAREGAKVAVLDINAHAAQEVAERIGGAAVAITCDVARKADVDAATAAALETFGTIDILVNNAGTAHRNRPMLEVEEAEFDRVFAVNVKSIFRSFRCSAATGAASSSTSARPPGSGRGPGSPGTTPARGR
jgi:3-oxoacyl-[acyl-carrier protein] reductase